MFEDSTFASTGKIRARNRAGLVAAFLFDSAVVVVMVVVPLLYPDMLPHAVNSILMNAPAVPVERPKPQPRATTARVVPAVLSIGIQPPRQIPKTIDYTGGSEPTAAINAADLADQRTDLGNDNPFAFATPVSVMRGEQHPIRVPSRVSEGLIIHRAIPVYPSLARQTRTQGTVVLQATISRDGTIENLRVVSGSPMLLQAALDAVSTWRYRPYMLNGQPIAVETTVNVVFKLDE